MELFLILLSIHIIVAIIILIILKRKGVFEAAEETGDGIRFAKPIDVVVQVLVMWEILLLIALFSPEDL